MRAVWMSKIWIKEDAAMKKIIALFGALNARNWLVLLALGCFFAACAKSEIVQDDTVANASQAVDPGDEGESAQEEIPTVPEGPGGEGYISPDHFDMIRVDFNACSDVDNPETKLFGLESAALREESLDEEDTKTYLGPVVDKKQSIYWSQGDSIKIYYASGAPNYTGGEIKHGDSVESTINGWVNAEDSYYYAFYPYNKSASAGIVTSVTYDGDATYAKGAFTVTVPSVQDGLFENCHMAVGKASKTNKSFAFSNVGSYLKITVANTDATAITLKSSDGGNIVGTFVVPFTDSPAVGAIGTPVVTSGSSSVTVNLPTPREANTVFYVALLPNVTFADGFRIRYEYGDGKNHPGYAYVKRTSGARDSRTLDRRAILNVGTLDTRIREEYFVKTTGSCTDVDVTGAGASWGNALDVAGLRDLIQEYLPQGSSDSHDRAWMLDGATIHIAAGDYYMAGAATTTASEPSKVKIQFANYGHKVKFSVKGGYPASPSGTGDWGRDTTSYRSAFTGNQEAGIFEICNYTDITFDGMTFKESAYEWNGAALNAGAGAYGDCSLTFTSCRFVDNTNDSSHQGAALYLTKAAATVSNCYFAGNEAGSSSCIHLGTSAGDVTISDCTFEGNTATGSYGAVQNTGKNGDVAITGCTFDNNTAASGAGAAFCATGGTTSIEDCTFSNNTASAGGAVRLAVGTTFTDCTFEDNTSSGNGGAFNVDAASLTLEDCTVSGNSSTSGDGGAVFLHSDGASFTATGCTFSGNYTDASNRNGGVLCLGRPGVEEDSQTYDVVLDNCVFSGNHTKTGVDTKGGVIYSAKVSQVLFKINGCLFKQNETGTRGIIHCEAGDCLLFLSRVSFYKNRTTMSDAWGVNIHAAGSTVCMINVTSYENYCSDDNPGNCAAFNSEGSWLILNSTIIDSTPMALVRSDGGASSMVTVANNILINQSTAANVVLMAGSGTWHRYYINDPDLVIAPNYCSCSEGQSVANGARFDAAVDWTSRGKLQYTGAQYHEAYDASGKYLYAVYDNWTYNESSSYLCEVTNSKNPITDAMGSFFGVAYSPRSYTNVGYQFYSWLHSFGAGKRGYMLDGRNQYRPAPTAETPVRWVFGAYQASY